MIPIHTQRPKPSPVNSATPRRRIARFFSYSSILLLSSLAVFSAVEALTPGYREAAQATETQSATATSNPWSYASFPVENFQAYTSPFGYRQSPYGGTQFHYGLDIASPQGSYVRNWWGGQVVEVSDDSACGTSVVVESGAWTHIYCHMQGYVINDGGQKVIVDQGSGLRIAQGSSVETGQPIGRVGMTGRTTGPHLHWGLKYQGNWVDPALVLRAMYEDQQSAMR
jgi:murein DD-endopeptidase MepM/ murein hydrolase activator NlpD